MRNKCSDFFAPAKKNPAEIFLRGLVWSVVLAYVQPLPEPLRNQLPEEDHEGVAAVDDHTTAGMPQYVHDACRDLFRAHQHRVAAVAGEQRRGDESRADVRTLP